MELGNAEGTQCFGHGDELCLITVETWSSWTDELTAEGSVLEKPHGAVRCLGMLSRVC